MTNIPRFALFIQYESKPAEYGWGSLAFTGTTKEEAKEFLRLRLEANESIRAAHIVDLEDNVRYDLDTIFDGKIWFAQYGEWLTHEEFIARKNDEISNAKPI